jgi:hypothetical protein
MTLSLAGCRWWQYHGALPGNICTCFPSLALIVELTAIVSKAANPEKGCIESSPRGSLRILLTSGKMKSWLSRPGYPHP